MKKLLCLVVSVILLLSNVGVVMATTEGIQQGDIMLLSNKSNDIAVGVCMDLGLIEGYPDGTFKGENEITRAEMTTIMVRLLGQSSLVASSETPFSDVPADHWASGYVNVAYSNKIVIGDGNGKFRPEDSVSYQEAVKMIASALGYEPAAADKGGYPTGYLVIASENGVLEDTINSGSAPASRATVAQLIYNALNAKRLVQTGFGEDKQYTYTTESILNKYLKMETKDIVIVANDIEAIDGNTKAKVGYIKDFEGNIYYAGKSDVGSKLGYLVTVYLKENKDEDAMEVLAYVDDKTTTSVVLDIAEIDSIENGIITTIEEDEYDIPVDSLTEEAIKNKEGLITLLFHKNDDVAKYVFVKEYVTDVITDINVKTHKIYLKKNATIVLDTEEKDDLIYSIVLNNNKAITTVADLQKNDIITYHVNSAKNYYEILVTRKTVEGTLNAISSEGDKEIYTIGDKDYYKSVYATDKIPTNPGSTGIFYLDAFDQLVDFEKSAISSTGKDYGYVLATKVNDKSFDNEYVVQMLTEKGVDIYTLAEKVYFDTLVADSTTKADAKEIDCIGQIVEYSLNSDGEIIRIISRGDLSYTENDKDYLNYDKVATAEYDAIDKELGKYYVTDDTLVFVVSGDKDDYKVTDISILKDKEIYNDVEFYTINDDKEANVVIIKDAITFGNADSAIALFVKSATKRNNDDIVVTTISFYENGKLVEKDCDTIKTDLPKTGDIFEYVVNDKDEITSIIVKSKTDSYDYKRPDDTNKPTYVAGQVYDKNDNQLKLGDLTGIKDIETHNIPSSANIYLVDNTTSKVKVNVADLGDVVANKYYYDKDSKKDKLMEEEDVFFVMIKYTDDRTISDIVIYKNFTDLFEKLY